MFLPPNEAMTSFSQSPLPLAASRQRNTIVEEYTKMRPLLTAGVERGPSPPWLSGVPLSAPPWYLAVPVGVAHNSLPVAASRATQTSAEALSMLRVTTVKTFPSPSTNELSPAGVETRHRHTGVPSGQPTRIIDRKS